MQKLHLGYKEEGTPNANEERPISASWGYDIHNHRDDPKRFRFTLRAVVVELGDDMKQWGVSLDAEIVGFFRHSDNGLDPNAEAYSKRLNGISLLYGTLRGVVAATTGFFPQGKMILPTIMPQEIVEAVEKQLADRRKQAENPAFSEGEKELPSSADIQDKA